MDTNPSCQRSDEFRGVILLMQRMRTISKSVVK